jgi:sugar lactone lactonase YvrE
VLGLSESSQAGVPWQRPFGVAARNGVVWVADPEGPGVLRLEWGAETARPVECRDRPWASPLAVAVGEEGDAWVADGGAGTVVRITASGCSVIGAGELERPSGVALGAGRVYVVDPPRHHVVAFAATGERLATIGDRGEEAGQLNYPTAVAVAADGTLLVVDALNFRISRYRADGAFLAGFGEPGDEGGALARPKAVAADGAGRVYVSDVQRDVVLVYSPGGEFLFAVGASGEGPGQFLMPAGLAVSGNRLFVADSYNRRIQAFDLLGENQ